MNSDNNERLGPVIDEAWPAAAPPSGFADKVLSKLQKDEPQRDTGRWRWGIVAACAALAFGALWLRQGPAPTERSGQVSAQSLLEVPLPLRATAVAQPGAALSWKSSGTAVNVNQTAGSVFYQVDSKIARDFRVQTPLGTVAVKGTSFEVELQHMKTLAKAGIVGAAVGAVLVVSVYEGRVLFEDKGGEQTQIAAGQKVTISGDGKPLVASRKPNDLQGLNLDALDETQLRAQANALAQKLDNLKRENDQLKKQLIAVSKHGGDGSEEDWLVTDKSTLEKFAKECRVRMDAPALNATGIEPKAKERLGISDEEEKQIVAALQQMKAERNDFVKNLYIEATGDVANTEKLEVASMETEIRRKAVQGEFAQIMKALSHERGGLKREPQDLSQTSALERLLRADAAMGDKFEARMAKIIGPERARRARTENALSGYRREYAGCPEDRDRSDDIDK